MNRRGFLQRAITAAAALAVVDPAELFWRPKLISIPAARPVYIRTDLPEIHWRMLHQGAIPSKYTRRVIGVWGDNPLIDEALAVRITEAEVLLI